eukprot:16428332-Heterocapsa_arctica.AAC.1
MSQEHGSPDRPLLIDPTIATPEGQRTPTTPVDGDERDGEFYVGRPVIAFPKCHEPTESERAAHELVHIPYAPWSTCCVSGRGKDNPHRQATGDICVPLLQLDYSYLKTGAKNDQLATILNAIRTVEGYGYSAVVD